MAPKATVSVELPPEFIEALEKRIEARLVALVEARFAALAPPEPAPEIIFAKLGAYAKRVGLSLRTLRDLVDAGLPVVGSRRLVRVDVRAADAWLRARREASASPLARSSATR